MMGHAKELKTGERHWYAVHTYSGYEDAVERYLKQRVESLGMGDKIFNVLVPKEKKSLEKLRVHQITIYLWQQQRDMLV